MVARNRLHPLSLGAETAQEVSGFSRIRPEIYSQNKHSGLYFANCAKKSRNFDVNGMYIKRSMKKRNEYSNVKAKRARQNVRKCARSCNFQKSKASQFSTNTIKLHVKPERMSRPIKRNFKRSSSNKKVFEARSQNQNDVDNALLNFKLRGVINKFESSFANVDEMQLTRKQYLNKLQALNEMIWNSKEIRTRASKARSILISNQVSIEKELIRRNLKLRGLKNDLNKELKKKRRSRFPQKSPRRYSRVKDNAKTLHMQHLFRTREQPQKCRHVVDYGSPCHHSNQHSEDQCIVIESNDRVKQTNFQFANMVSESGQTENQSSIQGVKSKILFNLGKAMGMDKSLSSPPHVTLDEKNEGDTSGQGYVPPTLDQSTEESNLTQKLDQIAEQFEDSGRPILSESNSLVFKVEESTEENSKQDIVNTESSEVSLLTENKDSSDSGEEFPTPQTTNAKSLKDGEEENEAGSMSSIHNSSSVHKMEVLKPKEDKEDLEFISSNPDEKPLREDGKLPPFPDVEAIMKYFEPFMIKLLDYVQDIKEKENPQQLMEDMEDVAVFIISIIMRLCENTHTK